MCLESFLSGVISINEPCSAFLLEVSTNQRNNEALSDQWTVTDNS